MVKVTVVFPFPGIWMKTKTRGTFLGMFLALNWRPKFRTHGEISPFYLWLSAMFVKHKHNLFFFKVKEKSHLELPISFQEPEQGMFLFHSFCPRVSSAAQGHPCGHRALGLESTHCARHGVNIQRL